MMRRSSISIFVLALSIGLVSCHASAPLRQEGVAQVPSITGQVTDLMGRSVQATTADVANGATVSLIDTATGQTVATTVTTPTGGFTLSFGSDFKPVTGKPYYMEAVKGLAVGGNPNRAGAAIARVRTILFYNWNGWSSLSGGVGFPVSIGKATTTVAAIVNLKGLSTASQSALVGTISGTTFTDPSHTIPSQDYSTVFALIDAAVTADRDPLEALAFDSSGITPAAQYVLKPGNLVIHDNYSVNGTPGPTKASLTAPNNQITFYGQNFPSSASVTIGPVPVATWSVNATRTQLTATLASNGYSGGLRITQGTSTWTGPFVPVSGTVGTLAGSGYDAFCDGKGSSANFSILRGMVFDSAGNLLVADMSRIRKVSPAGDVTTFAGSGVAGSANGAALAAQFKSTAGLALDGSGNLYVGEIGNADIRKITPSGTVTTLAGSGVAGFADGTGAAAQFSRPLGLAVDGSGNVYVADVDNNRIRKVTSAGVVSTYAGTGNALFLDGATSSAQFNQPTDVALDLSGNLFVADHTNHRIRKITPAGAVSTYAGSGVAGFADGATSSAKFNAPERLKIDNSGNLYVTEQGNHRIRKITPDGVVTTVAGSGAVGYLDGATSSVQLNTPEGLVLDSFGNIHFSDFYLRRVRVITP